MFATIRSGSSTQVQIGDLVVGDLIQVGKRTQNELFFNHTGLGEMFATFLVGDTKQLIVPRGNVAQY